jgi:SnoaL-like domain
MAKTQSPALEQAVGTPVSDLDHVALSRLSTECVWRVDHGLGTTVYELFTEDGEIWYEGELFCAGHDALKEWGKQRLDPESIRHTGTNFRFLEDGPDGAKGTGVEIVYYAAENRNGPEAALPLMIGEWDFRCVRTEQGWRFSYINYHVMFDRRENPGALF